ncbi:hypothetical protein AAFF_G00386470 [Aldrovandia affinis]|uniref:Reverse transcriptase domain-containing protein n=1 Tax=Aldrovandia affinis TaxID=143900 RepID=A0AAD7SF51_9TELE|nr:hypothetical protein AAFF_G00386470 [Aldrovandia affinis]
MGCGLVRGYLYPLPCINGALDFVSGSTWFSILDLSSYWQVLLSPLARPKMDPSPSAGDCGSSTHQLLGLCKRPATFERLMEKIQRLGLASACVVYLDDILVHAATYATALNNLCLVFQQIAKAHLCLKCSFFRC